MSAADAPVPALLPNPAVGALPNPEAGGVPTKLVVDCGIAAGGV